MVSVESSLTERLRSMSRGDREIADAVLREVLPRLRMIAAAHLARERAAAPVSPTELINEVWLRRIGRGGWQINNREHFYSIAAHAMRCVLVDFARRRLAQSNGGGRPPLSLDDVAVESQWTGIDSVQVVEIGMLMDGLERTDPLAARIVELHYFTGFTLEEAAQITNLNSRTARRRWAKAKRWLREGLASQTPRTIEDRGRLAL